MLVLFAWLLFSLLIVDHQFGQVSIADLLWGALCEEVYVVFIVFELFVFLQFRLSFNANLFVIFLTDPVSWADILSMFLDPINSFFFFCEHRLFQSNTTFVLHSIIKKPNCDYLNYQKSIIITSQIVNKKKHRLYGLSIVFVVVDKRNS